MRTGSHDSQVVDRPVTTASGRELLVQEGGDERGRAVLVQLGTPSSRMLYRRHLLDATERGIRLIAYDRPGYGGSTPDPGRSVADCAQDVRTILEALEIDRFAVFSAVDAAALTDELGDYFARRNRAGLAPGIEGWWDDSVAMLKPWGFSVETIRVPVMVLHGRPDLMVPFGHGEWLARRVTKADPHLTDDDGHLTLLQNRVPEVHAWLLGHF